jgi:hypothetical protein
MKAFVFVELLAIGILLIVFGIDSSNSFSPEVSRLFTGLANKAIWIIIAGGVSSIVGSAGLIREFSSER